jgi:hypothetical protein
MLNAGMVNSKCVCLPRADFCEIFLDSGRFLRFKKPFKYIHGFQINQKQGLEGKPMWRPKCILLCCSNTLANRAALRVPQSLCAKLVQYRKGGSDPARIR